MIKLLEILTKKHSLLVEIKKAEIIILMKKYFDDCSRKYFNDEYKKYVYPKFVVKPNIKHAGAYIPQQNNFVLNLDFANDMDTLKSTMYHETIHYYQTKAGKSFSRILFKLHGYHDDYFKEMMKKINSSEGSNFISIVANYKMVKGGKSVKLFWVYVLKRGNLYKMTWSPTRNEKFIERWKRILDYYKYDEGFIFQTGTLIFKENPRAKNGGHSVSMGEIKPGDKYYIEMINEFERTQKEKI